MRSHSALALLKNYWQRKWPRNLLHSKQSTLSIAAFCMISLHVWARARLFCCKNRNYLTFPRRHNDMTTYRIAIAKLPKEVCIYYPSARRQPTTRQCCCLHVHRALDYSRNTCAMANDKMPKWTAPLAGVSYYLANFISTKQNLCDLWLTMSPCDSQLTIF